LHTAKVNPPTSKTLVARSAHSPEKGEQPLPQFSAHVYCRQMAEWSKMSLGIMEVGLGPGHTVLDGDPAPPPKNGA